MAEHHVVHCIKSTQTRVSHSTTWSLPSEVFGSLWSLRKKNGYSRTQVIQKTFDSQKLFSCWWQANLTALIQKASHDRWVSLILLPGGSKKCFEEIWRQIPYIPGSPKEIQVHLMFREQLRTPWSLELHPSYRKMDWEHVVTRVSFHAENITSRAKRNLSVLTQRHQHTKWYDVQKWSLVLCSAIQ